MDSDLSRRTAEIIKNHQDDLRNAYKLFSSVENDGLQLRRGIIDESKAELWFLACKLTGTPSSMCGVFVVYNSKERPIRFTPRGISASNHKSFNRMVNALYAREGRHDCSEQYRDQLQANFDLRRTRRLGIAIVNMAEESIIETIPLDDLSSISYNVCDTQFSSRNLVFRLNKTKHRMLDTIDTGSYDECVAIGPNEAISRNSYGILLRSLYDPYSSGVSAGLKTDLRQRIVTRRDFS